MFEELLVTPALPFTAALVVLIILSLINILTALAGLTVFDFMDSWVPDFDGDVIVDDVLSADSLSPGFLQGFLLWLNLGKVPMVVTLNLFLFFFAIAGFLSLSLGDSLGINALPWALTIPVAILATIVPVKIGNRLMSHIWPKDETAAVDSDSFIGRVATITIGVATHERAAEAKLKGPLGRPHYVMVFADNEDDSFPQGSSILLVGRRETKFTGIAVTNANLES